ncbi:maestro heat-like repeat-containing protein family member 1 [Anopheles cruzii]|uniref:maestro heat-like repeat-containing protein family member 1 n=1 Tax=Anopheles cruzii TaxID=68878 RepID=UPI0022EC5768|nr:maestro heat-like repeat-containing protein family member 1 [Anopheles cruzii]
MFGVCLCHTTDEHMICNKIDLIFELAKAEKVDKNAPNEEYEQPMQDYADSLGYVAVTHLDKVMAKLGSTVIDDNSVKKSNSFFSHLSFIKDSAKELEIYKMKILTLEALNVIVYRAPKEQLLHHFTETVINYLIAQFDSKELFIKQLILDTLLASIDIFMTSDWEERMTGSKIRSDLHKMCLTITSDTTNEYLPVFPSIIKLSTVLVKLHAKDQVLSVNGLLDSICFYFFSNAHNLKLRSNSIDNDTQNSFLATFLNLALPEVNRFIQQVLEQQDASPASLDDVHSILEGWLKDKNCEARICACHVYNSTLAVYMKSTKIGCEGPSKFNQTGSMLGKIIPRCIDSNATVRQTAVEVLTKILEIAYIYETVTVADDRVEWLVELKKIHDEIVTDDPKEIYRIAGELARIVAQRLSSYQYVKFCKCLLGSINDPEQSSVIGASHVLKLFMHVKGAEMYHAIPELIKDCLYAVKLCEISRARAAIVKSILALTKHHPKLVCNEILSQSLPLEE